MCTSWDVHKTIPHLMVFNDHELSLKQTASQARVAFGNLWQSLAIAKKSYFPLDGEGHMNDHSKQKSVNSRRSFIAGFGGVLAAAAAPQKQRWAEVLNVKVSWFQQVHR